MTIKDALHDLKWFHDVDFVPNPMEDYYQLPAPFPQLFKEALKDREDNFAQRCRDRKAEYE